jgi:hypothetical protein
MMRHFGNDDAGETGHAENLSATRSASLAGSSRPGSLLSHIVAGGELDKDMEIGLTVPGTPDDGLVTVGPVLDRVKDFAALIADQADEAGFATLRAAEHTGRPLGTQDFIAGLERMLGRRIARRAPGRKPTNPPGDQQSLF